MTDEANIEAGGADDAGEYAAADAAIISALETEVAALKEQVLRYAADMENTRRRAEREVNDARAFAIQKFARDLLGVADNLSRAVSAVPADAADPALKNLLTGIEMTEKELLGAFERNGLKQVDSSAGTKFDPHQHQAVMEQASAEVGPGGVIQTFQTGYELFGRIVRPAMVVVASKDSAGAPPPAEPAAANPYAQGEGAEADHTVDTKA